MHYPYIANTATPWQESPCSEGYEIHNFGKPFLGHHYYSCNFLIFAQEEKRFFLYKKYIFLLFDKYGHVIAQKTLPKNHKIYNFGKFLLSLFYFFNQFIWSRLRNRKGVFKEKEWIFNICVWPRESRSSTRNFAQVMKFTNRVEPCFIIITIHLYMLRSRE